MAFDDFHDAFDHSPASDSEFEAGYDWATQHDTDLDTSTQLHQELLRSRLASRQHQLAVASPQTSEGVKPGVWLMLESPHSLDLHHAAAHSEWLMLSGYRQKALVHDIPVRVRLMRLFSGGEDLRIRAFLVEHPDIIDILLEAYSFISTRLRPSGVPKLSLQVYSQEEDDCELIVTIPTTSSVSEGLDDLAAFDNEWWLDRPDEIRRLVTFELAYQ